MGFDVRLMDGTKLLWHMQRVIDHFDLGVHRGPIHIDMGIAKFCNIRCVFCYGLSQGPSREYIQRKALMDTMRLAPVVGVRSIGFIGDGEPTCNPHVYDALRVGAENGLDLALSTNGLLIDTDEKRDAVLESCTWMRFCFSAGTAEGYHKIHGVDRFDAAVRSVRKMVERKHAKGYGCDIGLQAVFVPTLMCEEMLAESKLAVDIGVDYLLIKQCSLPDRGESGMVQFDVGMYDDPEVIATLQECEAMSTLATTIAVKFQTMQLKGQRPYDGCPSIPFISEISGNGDWYPCGHMFGGKPKFEAYKFGNLHEQNIMEIVRSDRYWEIVRMMREEFDVHTQCRGQCRQDHCNRFLYRYLNKPKGINFI